MRLITATLAVAFIALTTLPAQAENAPCLPPVALHELLIKNGMILFSYGMVNGQFIISTYVSPDSFAVVAETDKVACIVAEGQTLYLPREHSL